MENNYKLDPLRDPLLLQEIFSNLTLPELKGARLVCRNWGEEGALNLRHRDKALNLHIHVNPPQQTYNERATKLNLRLKKWTDLGLEDERGALGDFLATYKLNHILDLSLLGSHPWHLSTPQFVVKFKHEVYELIHQVYYHQENELEFAANILDHYLPKMDPFIKELRLELMLKKNQDFEMLENILESVEQVEKCCLEIAVFNDKLLQEIKPSKEAKRSKVKTLAIRLIPAIQIAHKGIKEQSLPVPGPSRLLSLFPNITFLDIIGLRPFSWQRSISNKISKLLDAATQLDLNLEGIRADARTEQDFQAVLNFTKTQRLKSLYLDVYWKGSGEESSIMIRALEEIVAECRPSLERFDLGWRPTDADVCPKLRLPQFENLKSLTYASKFVGRQEGCCLPLDKIFEGERLSDCFGLGEFFKDSGRIFHLKFPALESLSLILLEPGERELWEELFPTENNGKCISDRIQTLVVTFAGECESEEIQKFPLTLFPKLRHFRHGKWTENGNKLYVCHHEYDPEGRYYRKWSWLAAIKKYRGFELLTASERTNNFDIMDFGDYIYTIREKFRLRLGDQGFWDTEYNIERTDFHWATSEKKNLDEI